MTYALLDSNGKVIAVYVYTPDQYAELLPEMQAQIISCPDDVVVDCILSDTGWNYPSDQLDAAFAANPSLYKENKCTIINAQFDIVLTNGFQYQGTWYKGDIRSQLWALGYMFSMAQGIMQPPVNWIAKNNTVTVFPTTQSFAAFISFFLGWGQQATFANFTLKGQIRAATTRADVDTLFNTYMAANVATS